MVLLLCSHLLYTRNDDRVSSTANDPVPFLPLPAPLYSPACFVWCEVMTRGKRPVGWNLQGTSCLKDRQRFLFTRRILLWICFPFVILNRKSHLFSQRFFPRTFILFSLEKIKTIIGLLSHSLEKELQLCSLFTCNITFLFFHPYVHRR